MSAVVAYLDGLRDSLDGGCPEFSADDVKRLLKIIDNYGDIELVANQAAEIRRLTDEIRQKDERIAELLESENILSEEHNEQLQYLVRLRDAWQRYCDAHPDFNGGFEDHRIFYELSSLLTVSDKPCTHNGVIVGTICVDCDEQVTTESYKQANTAADRHDLSDSGEPIDSDERSPVQLYESAYYPLDVSRAAELFPNLHATESGTEVGTAVDSQENRRFVTVSPRETEDGKWAIMDLERKKLVATGLSVEHSGLCADAIESARTAVATSQEPRFGTYDHELEDRYVGGEPLTDEDTPEKCEVPAVRCQHSPDVAGDSEIIHCAKCGVYPNPESGAR